MKGMKPDEYIREPFIWGDTGEDPGQPSWINPRYSNSQSVTPLTGQINENESIYFHYQNLIKLRNSSATLSLGGISDTGNEDQEIISFYRYFEGDTITVIHNLSGSGKNFELEGDLIFGNNATSEGSEFEIGPYGTIVVD